MTRTGVKICGVTRPRDARLAVEMGAEYLGLNFWPGSPRCVSRDQARRIAEAVRGRVRLVGLWVDPSHREVASVDRDLGLDLLQFHGNHSPEALDWFPNRVIQAIRIDPNSAEIRLDRYAAAWGLLFDCAPAGVFGGTGQSWPYERIAHLEAAKPILLAGGLSPDNVAVAIARSGADIVDVCSGVESKPGVKDPDLLERFLREVRHGNNED